MKKIIVVICLLLLTVMGCGVDTKTPVLNFSYKPPMLPVAFVVSSNGEISVEGNTSIVDIIGNK